MKTVDEIRRQMAEARTEKELQAAAGEAAAFLDTDGEWTDDQVLVANELEQVEMMLLGMETQ